MFRNLVPLTIVFACLLSAHAAGAGKPKLPLVGDETPASAIRAAPTKYEGKKVIICGYTRVTRQQAERIPEDLKVFVATVNTNNGPFVSASILVAPREEDWGIPRYTIPVDANTDMGSALGLEILRELAKTRFPSGSNPKATADVYLRLEGEYYKPQDSVKDLILPIQTTDLQFLSEDGKSWQPWILKETVAKQREERMKKRQEKMKKRMAAAKAAQGKKKKKRKPK